MIYKIMACSGSVFTCRWMHDGNAHGAAMKNQCPSCGASMRFAQTDDPKILAEWCEENRFPIPRWLEEAVSRV